MVTGRSFRDRNPSSRNSLEASFAFGTWGVVRSYPSRSELFQQGTPADDVYFIHQGMVKLVWGEAGGKQTILGLRRDGCLIGVPAVVTGEPYPTSAVTLVPSIMERISAEKFLQRLQNDPDFAWQIHQIQSREVQEQLNWLGAMGCCSARLRLRRVLSGLTEFSKVQKQSGVRLPLKQREVAELIAVTPEHLNRLLHELSKDGLLHLQDGWIVIPDTQAQD
jgi:CRP/FNR family transcriptional regulator